jgi:hypothetical protein
MCMCGNSVYIIFATLTVTDSSYIFFLNPLPSAVIARFKFCHKCQERNHRFVYSVISVCVDLYLFTTSPSAPPQLVVCPLFSVVFFKM